MRSIAIIFAALVVAPTAFGASTASALETTASAFASSIAERPVQAVCNTQGDWLRLTQEVGFDAQLTWGFVVFRDGSPLDETQLSDRACLYLEAFHAAKDKEAMTVGCRIGTRLVVKGTRARRARREPVYGRCPDYGLTLSALVTLAHESVHLRGFVDEGVVECFAMQLMDDAARWLGAPDALASRLAADYWADIYTRLRPDSDYYHPDCVDGSPLDLSPGPGAWPAGGDTILSGP
ncbi:MAG: hypothetical protein WD689_09750 [Gaiellaceae bacterium]